MKSNEKGVNTLLVKDMNTRLVLKALRSYRTATVKELAQATELTVVTVKDIVRDLIAHNKVYEGGTVPSKGGRPSKQYVFNENSNKGLVVFTRELNGHDSICVRVVDLYGQVKESVDHQVDTISVAKIENLISHLIKKHPSIGAISIGLPGIEFEGRIVALDYQSTIGDPIIQRLREKFNLPVIIENDVNAAVLGHDELEDSRDTEVYIYFPRKYPPGAGIKVNGKLLKGNRHFAGEIGWLPLDIPWGPELADSFDEFTAAASKVVLSMITILDPDSVVLFGEFLTDTHLKEIIDKCKRGLPQRIIPELSLAEDFSLDFERGLIGLTLEALGFQDTHIYKNRFEE